MKTEGLQAGEDLAARGATQPRVTLDDIKDNVGAVFFTTADVLMPELVDEDTEKYVVPLSILTICVVVLRNGFTLLGKSAPASPENFDADKGKEFAYEDALRQAWPLMGYALRDRLHRDSADAEAYMRATGQTTEPVTGVDPADQAEGNDLVDDTSDAQSPAAAVEAIPAVPDSSQANAL